MFFFQTASSIRQQIVSKKEVKNDRRSGRKCVHVIIRVLLSFTRDAKRARDRENRHFHRFRRAKQKSHKLQARVIECGVGIPARDWPSWSGSIVWIISCSRPWRNLAWLSLEWEDGPPRACSQPCPAPVPPPPPPPAPLLLPPLLLHPASPGAGMPLLPHAPDTPPTLVSLLLVAFGCCWNTHTMPFRRSMKAFTIVDAIHRQFTVWLYSMGGGLKKKKKNGPVITAAGCPPWSDDKTFLYEGNS